MGTCRVGVNNELESIVNVKYGNALLSKYPIDGFENHRFGDASIGEKGFLLAKLRIKNEILSVVVTHLDYKFAKNRKKQCEQMIAELKKIKGPLIVMGDFNCALDMKDEPLKEFVQEMGLRYWPEKLLSFPSNNPDRALDHFFVSPDLKVNRCFVRPLELSDHLPVLMELE